MASFPTYEPADFVNGITATQFRELTSEDNFSPILNRAIQGTYAPGSTFKLITALAALQEGVLGGRGSSTADRPLSRHGHLHVLELLRGIEYVSLQQPLHRRGPSGRSPGFAAGLERHLLLRDRWRGFLDPFERPDEDGLRPDEGIQLWARQLGLGSDSGLQVPYERSGAVPDRDYYDRQFDAGVFAVDGSQWFAGATINLSIGQGELLVTPLQLANAYATFGNGGALHQPNVAVRVTDPDGEMVREFGPRVLRDLEIPEEFQAPIEEGLLGATMDTGGTATRVFGQADFNVWNWPVAGKTGTAEVDLKADTSLFAAYGPVYRPGSAVGLDTVPEVALSVVLEESGFGSASAAPVAAAIFEHLATDTVPVARSLNETARYALGLIDDDGQTTTSVGANG